MIRIVLIAGVALVGACNQAQQSQPVQQERAQANAVRREPAVDHAPTTGANALPESRTVLIEPKGPTDPTSVEAAGQVVQHYVALIEQGRTREAGKLWGDEQAAASFAHELRPIIHAEIGELGGTEGAAGSIYTTIPVVIYGDSFRRPARVILRRVNDVPGSTIAQRRWQIERIEWAGPA